MICHFVAVEYNSPPACNAVALRAGCEYTALDFLNWIYVMRYFNNRRGLTLIEVLLASALLSVAMVSMLTAISRCLQVFHISSGYHEAMWALTMAEVENPLIKTLSAKDFDPDDYEVSPVEYGDVTYERCVEDPYEDDEDSEVRLLVIKTKLSWMGRNREKDEEITRYLLYREN